MAGRLRAGRRGRLPRRFPAVNQPPPAVVVAVRSGRPVVILTGAGMSAESGIPTFRDAQTGLWAHYDPMMLATPEAFAEDPDLVWAWYAWRIGLLAGCEPNDGHVALAELGTMVEVAVVTQNVDDLHERAGSREVVHLHGRLQALRCADCGTAYPQSAEVAARTAEQPGPDQGPGGRPTEPPRCPPPRCECGGPVRPGVVWFGEPLPVEAFSAAERLVNGAATVLVIGTFGLVYPAAGLPAVARAAGAQVIEINPEPTMISDVCHHRWR
ncbi:MAG: hypothetical protein CSA58_05570, partial [Micrococcales bacterium]